MIIRKTPEEIDKIAAAGEILARCHEMLRARRARASPPRELDKAAESFIRSQGAEPAFKGYRGFPGSICASPNSMVVHGIPGSYALEPRRHPLGRHRRGARRLGGRRRDHAADRQRHAGGHAACSPPRAPSLFDAVEQCRPGNRLGDVSHAVQSGWRPTASR